MSAATLEATDGRVGVTAPAPITFTQVMNNVPLTQSPITSAAFATGGNPLLVSASTSGWSSSGNAVISSGFTIVPTPSTSFPAGTPTVPVNPNSQHVALVRSWALATGVPASATAVVKATTLANTVQDLNDTACVTVCELGLGAPLAVRAAVPPTGTGPVNPGQPIFYQPFMSFGGHLLIRAAGSGWPSNAGTLVSLAVELDGQEVARTEVFASDASHRATVPVDVLVDAPPGPHVLAIRPLSYTGARNDQWQWDFSSALALEQMGPPGAVEISPLLVNTPCLSQTAGTAALATFASGGGTLVIHASASAQGHQAGPVVLTVELDSQPLVLNGTTAVLRQLANVAGIHLTLNSNDLVVPGVPAGSHTLALVGDANTTTDSNDRCSITVMELGPAAG